MTESRRETPSPWPKAGLGTFTVLLLTMAACSPVWSLTRSDEIVLPLRLDESITQSVAFIAKFPGRRYRVFLRFDRTLPFEEIKCLVRDLLEDTCGEPALSVQFDWIVSVGESVVVQGNAVPRFRGLAWTDAYVEALLGEFHPESGKLYQLSVRVNGDGGRLSELRPKRLALSYYNPLDKSIHVSPGRDAQPLPNITFDRTAGSPSLAAAGQRGRWAASKSRRIDDGS
jgi:hypothetical protein